MISFNKKAQYRLITLKAELEELLKEVQSIQDKNDKIPVYKQIGLKGFEIWKLEKLYKEVI